MLTTKQKLILFLISCEPGIKDIYTLVKIFDRADFPAAMTENIQPLLDNNLVAVSEHFANGTPNKYEITESGKAYLADGFNDNGIINCIKSMDNPGLLLEITQAYIAKRNTNNEFLSKLNNTMNNPDNPITTSIAPWLTVPDSTRAVTFYKAAFGAIEAYRLDVPHGGPIVRLSVDGAEFWVSEEPNPEVHAVGGGSVRMILTVKDPDILFAQALQAGASEVFPVGEGHGWRLGRLADPFGLHWEIGHPLKTG